MVGKPNFPPDADTREDLMGMSMPTDGLTPLDQEREASMADEGGMSGAVMESEDGDYDHDPTDHRPRARAPARPTQAPAPFNTVTQNAPALLLAAGGVSMGVWAIRWALRKR